MKFEEVLPLMRQGKKAYLTKCVHSWWEGQEKYFLQYFESMDDFKSKYPNTRLRMPGENPFGSFLASFYNTGDNYLNPSVMNFDFYFYSDIIVGSEWEVFN